MPLAFVEMLGTKPIMIYWSLEDACRITGMTPEQAEKSLHPVEVSPLSLTVQRYFEYRGLKMPDRTEAFLFLTSELGELSDELVQEVGGWVRNNPKEKGKGIAPEAGDVLMMLLVFAMQPDTWFDPIEAMFAKMASKGFPINASRQKGGEEE